VTLPGNQGAFDPKSFTSDQLRALAELLDSMDIRSIKHDFRNRDVKANSSLGGAITVEYRNTKGGLQTNTIWRRQAGF
jgi:hypothetical protein